jgi:hypothetical protein
MYKKFRTKTNVQKVKTAEIVIFIIITAIIIGLYPLWENSTNKVSINILIKMDENRHELKQTISFLARLMTSIGTHLIITSVIFNFSNVFKLLVANFLFYISIGLSAILKLIFITPMIFLKSEEFIEPSICLVTWGSPSVPSIHITAISFSIWWMYIRNRQKLIKISTFLVCLVIVVFSNFCLLFQGIYSLSDILLSFVIGVILFVFVFLILKLDVDNSSDMKVFVNSSKLSLVINIGAIITIPLLYYLRIPSKEVLFEYQKKIACTDCYFTFPDNLDPSYDSICLLVIFLSNFSIRLGLYLEKIIINSNDENKWGFFNFQGDQNELASIYTFSDKFMKAQWNDTSFSKTIYRILISLAFISSALALILFVPYSMDYWYLTLAFKYFLPMGFYTFSTFFIQKYIFVKFDLVNSSAFSYESNSANSTKNDLSAENSLIMEDITSS